MNAPGLICLIILFFFQSFVPQAEFSGKCVGVIDGDTIDVLRNGRAVRIRLEGIDCPERDQDFGSRAKQFTSGLVFGKTVNVKVKEPDRYGRLVARVIAEGRDVSHELVKAGLAWHFKKYSSDLELAKLEDKAREARIGIWSMPNPAPPWDFRHHDRAPGSKTNTDSVEGRAVAYHGNVNSRVFHRPSCPSYDCRNCTRILNSREEALAAGFKPCGVCRP